MKGAPVEGVGVLGLHRELCLAKRLGAAFAGEEASVEGFHQLAGWLVGDLPEAHDQRLDPGQDERSAEAEDALADAGADEAVSVPHLGSLPGKC